MWRNRNPRQQSRRREAGATAAYEPATGGPVAAGPADGKPADGAFQAMDQIANWVRFADTKATILTAGLGVVMTMLVTNADTIVAAIEEGCAGAAIVGGLAAGAVLAVAWTLFWLVRAIGPQSAITYQRLNRFAWPSLHHTTAADLTQHASRVDVRDDAWQQVIDLSALARRKFKACGYAVSGFASLVVLGIACVLVAIMLTT